MVSVPVKKQWKRLAWGFNTGGEEDDSPEPDPDADEVELELGEGVT